MIRCTDLGGEAYYKGGGFVSTEEEKKSRKAAYDILRTLGEETRVKKANAREESLKKLLLYANTKKR